MKNDIFMAAVDCTGHGVPGALLSQVGYFLLNDIVRSRKITNPGRILDLPDEGVATTLRPDEDAGSKDGMDISLCRIDREHQIVEYRAPTGLFTSCKTAGYMRSKAINFL